MPASIAVALPVPPAVAPVPAFIEFGSDDAMNIGQSFDQAIAFFTVWHRATPQAPWRYLAE